MSESRQHINQYNAIDIQRYLEGKMSAAEMHALEKASLDDPFLADAIEGMESAGKEHGHELILSNIEQLQQQLATRADTGKVIPLAGFRWWRVAAAALILMIAGAVFFKNNSNEETTKDSIAVAEQPASIKSDTASAAAPPEKIDLQKLPLDTAGVIKDNTAPFTVTQEQILVPDNIPGREPRASLPPPRRDLTTVGPASPSRSDETVVIADRKREEEKSNITRNEDSISIIERDAIARPSPYSDNKEVIGKTANDDLAAINDPSKKMKKAGSGAISNQAINFFNGRVTDSNNQPIANATVQVLNNYRSKDKVSNNSIVTDQYGFFKLPSPDTAVKVMVTVVGYNTQTVNLRNDLTLNSVQLAPANPTLSEAVVVTSRKGSKNQYNSKAPSVLVQDAEPAGGWIEFDKYISSNKKISSDSNSALAGEVVVSFLVNRKSELSSFRIEQSLSAAQDAEALRLIKEGPSWKLIKGKKARILVIIRF